MFGRKKPMHIDKPREFVPRVTPDPDRARELERRFNAVAYRPTNGFHRDQRQPKKDAKP